MGRLVNGPRLSSSFINLALVCSLLSALQLLQSQWKEFMTGYLGSSDVSGTPDVVVNGSIQAANGHGPFRTPQRRESLMAEVGFETHLRFILFAVFI